MKKSTLAIPAAAAEIPVKPNTPAMIETIKKNNANLSILSLRCSFSPGPKSDRPLSNERRRLRSGPGKSRCPLPNVIGGPGSVFNRHPKAHKSAAKLIAATTTAPTATVRAIRRFGTMKLRERREVRSIAAAQEIASTPRGLGSVRQAKSMLAKDKANRLQSSG
jgi:hypothetical protein